MSELLTMYPAQPNSPVTTLTGALTVGQTSFAVADVSVLPAPPNLLVIGGDTPHAETVLMTAKNTSTNMVTVARAMEGSEFSWPAGTIVGRFFTAKELNDIITNITALNNGKAEKASVAQSGNYAALDENGNLIDSGTNNRTFALVGHNHDTDYMPFAEDASGGNFPVFTSDGNLQDSGYAPSSFASSSHTHAYIPTSQKNAASGVAGLDSAKKINAEQASSAMVTITAARSLVSSDAGKMLICNFADNGEITVPPDSGVSFPVGTEIEILRYGEGVVSVKPSGVYSDQEQDQLSNTRTSNTKYTLMTASSYTYNDDTGLYELVDPAATTNAKAVAGLYIVTLAVGNDDSTTGATVYRIDAKPSTYVYTLTPIVRVFLPDTTVHSANGNTLSSRYSAAALKKLAVNEWLLAGDLS